MSALWSRAKGPSAPITPLQAFFVVFALSFVALACWSFANPLVAAPDEQTHMIRAYALDHGQLGHSLSRAGDRSEVEVTVPASVNFTKTYPQCFQFKATSPASCAPAWDTSTSPVATNTYVGHYPPLYYALVGVGSWFSAHVTGLYLMRLVSSLICAFMIGLTAYVIARWSRRRTIAVGVAVALTPIVWFLAASVNPSGFEIVTAICLWTALSVFATDYVDNPPKALVAIIGATGATLVLIRGLSPLFVVVIGVVIAVLVGPRRLFALIRRRRDVQFALGAIVVAALLAAAWIFSQGTLNIAPDGAKVAPGTSQWELFRMVAHHVRDWIRQSVGVLGWLDTPMPHWFYDLWYVMITVLGVGGLVFAALRAKIALLAVTVLCVLVPLVLVFKQAHTLGIVWQGRDSMPLSVGVPILGAALWPRSRPARVAQRWAGVGLVGLVTLLSLGSFYLNLRRYAVGRSGSRLFFLHSGGWSPPTGTLETLLIYGVSMTVLGVLVAGWLISPSRPLDDAFASR